VYALEKLGDGLFWQRAVDAKDEETDLS